MSSLETANALDDLGSKVSVAEFDKRISQIVQRGIENLNLAASRGHIEAVKSLSAISSIKKLDEALGWAAFAGQLKVVQMLVHQGASFNAFDAHGRTPVHWAAYMGHQAVFQWLLGQGADALRKETQPPRYTPIDIAVWKGRRNLLAWLTGASQSQVAIDELQAPIMEALLSRPQMCRAAAGGHLEVARWLLSIGVQVDQTDEDGKTPLWHAAEARHGAMCSWLVSQGASPALLPPAALSELLCAAAQIGDAGLLQAGIAAGARVNGAGSCGITPIQWAIRGKWDTCVRLLCAVGADILVPVANGNTILPRHPLHAAVFLNTHEPKMLLCDPDAIESRHGGDQRGRTLLHQAVRSGSSEWLAPLTYEKQLQLVADCDGRLPLHDACGGGVGISSTQMASSVTSLLKHCPDVAAAVAAEDIYGRVPAELIPRSSWGEVWPLMLEVGSVPPLERAFKVHVPRLLGFVSLCVAMCPLLPSLSLAAMLRTPSMESAPALLWPGASKGASSLLDLCGILAVSLTLIYVVAAFLLDESEGEHSAPVLPIVALVVVQYESVRRALRPAPTPPSPPEEMQEIEADDEEQGNSRRTRCATHFPPPTPHHHQR